MAAAVWILTIFATIWGVFGQKWAGLPTAWLALPAIVSVALLAWALPAARGMPSPPGARRIVAIWSGVEVAAIFLAVNLLPRFHHADAIASVIAMIVGAHFLPLARGLKVPGYWLSGGALIVLGAAAFALDDPMRTSVTCWGAAAILWATVTYVGLRARSLRTAGA